MVETALAAPFVLMLLAGGAQVGAISYGQVTIDTAAREGARVATEHPVAALTSTSTGTVFFSTSTSTSYTCNGGTDTNPVCQAVYSAPGLFQTMFDKSRFTVVITANVPAARAPDDVPDDVQRVSCSGGVSVSGTITNADNTTGGIKYDVSASGTGQTLTTTANSGQGTYSLCVSVSSTQAETITASFGTLTCGLPHYQGSTQLTLSPSGGPYTADISVSEQTCPTPTPTPQTTTTPTAGPAPSGTPLPGSMGTFSCTSPASFIDGTYITVKVSYPMPLFVPFLGSLFDTGGGQHVATATVTMRVEPCSITQGT
jgi:hypothetical protein